MNKKWLTLFILALAELLAMSLQFSASAVAEEFQEMWALSQSQAGWLTAVVQLGFVAGRRRPRCSIWPTSCGRGGTSPPRHSSVPLPTVP
ncbi:MAG: hypothetical protein GTN78_25710 [Gemmatimonadales bacterium]|nr:hypothetical protein [Gemmatimonadales bacterium]NIN12556.1 hypothetical protein [Gemmatimonadales bacterium]NIR03551.1 hypothetical protein [Gemmatimonadales bacterium]NIS65873.1 hypothetical protein [Gemmatimonadales bacterium]